MTTRVRGDATWHESGPLSAVESRLREALGMTGGRVTLSEHGKIDASFGSRTMYRIFGSFTERGRRSLPFNVEIRLQPDGDRVQVVLEWYSNQGRYLLSLPNIQQIFHDHVEATIEDLKPRV